jgi:hypothetical protein
MTQTTTTKLVTAPETLWYEDEDSNVVPHVLGETPSSKKRLYQHTRSVGMRHNVTGSVQQSDVDACSHDDTKPTSGWIEGVEGRECCGCKGTQVRHLPEPWPEKWEGGACYNLIAATSGWDSNVVNAMVRSFDYNTFDAVLIAATACERCWNVLLRHYFLRDEDVGDDHGYPIGSDEEALAGTSCILCDQVTEMCKGDSVPCRGNHHFIFTQNRWECIECSALGVELDDVTMKRHTDAGGEELPSIVSETVYKYKVRGKLQPAYDGAGEVADCGNCCDPPAPPSSSS